MLTSPQRHLLIFPHTTYNAHLKSELAAFNWHAHVTDDVSTALKLAHDIEFFVGFCQLDAAENQLAINQIRFDSTKGPFGKPQTIHLKTNLPELAGEIIVDGNITDRLWQPTGVTISGGKKVSPFRIAKNAQIKLLGLTIADGLADQGGGVFNQGNLVVKGITFNGNHARKDGGGLVNLGGKVDVINCTFVNNVAENNGGGLANNNGHLTVTHATFSGNKAENGGGLFSDGELLIRNSILANSAAGNDCEVTKGFNPASTHNLIELNQGCGEPISIADPKFETLGSYNGSTQTLPLGGGSPAINLGDNASSLDENGQPLEWDQRGNGDPRFVAGFSDLGAFEVQAFPEFRVNTLDDSKTKACSGMTGDCSLRAAITLANAMQKSVTINFDAKLFATQQTLSVNRPLPEVTIDLTLDATGTGGVTIKNNLITSPDIPAAKITLKKVELKF